MVCSSQSPEALAPEALLARLELDIAAPAILARWPRAAGRQGRSSARTRRVRLRRETSGNLGCREP